MISSYEILEKANLTYQERKQNSSFPGPRIKKTDCRGIGRNVWGDENVYILIVGLHRGCQHLPKLIKLYLKMGVCYCKFYLKQVIKNKVVYLFRIM